VAGEAEARSVEREVRNIGASSDSGRGSTTDINLVNGYGADGQRGRHSVVPHVLMDDRRVGGF
jgi:hypothetical protein